MKIIKNLFTKLQNVFCSCFRSHQRMLDEKEKRRSMENGLIDMNAFLFVCSDKSSQPKAGSPELDDAAITELAPTFKHENPVVGGRSCAVSIMEIEDDQQEVMDLEGGDFGHQD